MNFRKEKKQILTSASLPEKVFFPINYVQESIGVRYCINILTTFEIIYARMMILFPRIFNLIYFTEI